ncbi:MAG: hypothetical protein F4107_08540 [Gemmatimonadetes bacterium]|nr:hypothetical protein [Gemmatimonadota bacterium]MYD13978.1 hypothetical protein [Gemmatimonadota bacterium]MYI65964.1 hypothetical protein [Gemmatimonadota bacterium]
MALLTFPDVAHVTVTDMALLRARTIHESPESLEREITDWGGAKWRGQSVIGPAQGDDQRAIEAFLADWSDPLNTAEIPTGRTAADVGAGAATGFTSPVLTAAGRLEINVAAVGADVAVGQLCRIGSRTYIIRVVAGQRLELVPGLVPDTADTTVQGVSTVLAAVAESSGLASRLRPRWGGPWTLSWDEAA